MDGHFLDDVTVGNMTHYFLDGDYVGMAIKNAFGAGYQFHDSSGKIVRAVENAHGGHDFWSGAKYLGSTRDHPAGGTTVIDHHGTPLAEAFEITPGQLQIWEEGRLAALLSSAPDSGFRTVIAMSDPLKHIHLYHMPSLTWT